MTVGALFFFSINFKSNSKNTYAVWYSLSTILGILMVTTFVFIAYTTIEGSFISDVEEGESVINSTE